MGKKPHVLPARAYDTRIVVATIKRGGQIWSKDEITYYVDGVPVQRLENTHWHQPLYLIFDSETMPDWFGMPRNSDLPSTFSVEYVRAWNRK